MDAYLALQAHKFLKRNWPFGAPFPALYYFPAGAAHGSRKSLHAKCVVVDSKRVLVGSANFTRRGHTRNLEVGVQLDDAALARALTSQLERLVEQGELARLPVAPVRELPPDAAEDEDEAGDEAALSEARDGSAPGQRADQLAEELYVSAEARPLFVRLLDAGLPVPQVGTDIEDIEGIEGIEGEDGEVLASPELSWPVSRVAVLLPEQAASRDKLEAADWTCFSLDDALAAEEFGVLCELVRRAE